MRGWLGTDLDGVIADTDPVFRKYIAKISGKYFPREAVTSYFYEKCLPISEEVVSRAYELMTADHVWEKIPLITGAKEILAKISDSFNVFVITARPQEAEKMTEKYVKDISLPVKKIYFLARDQRKIEVIKNFPSRVFAFVEDRLDFAKEIALYGIKTFLFDYPWNRTDEKIANLERVFNWKQIENSLLGENQNNKAD